MEVDSKDGFIHVAEAVKIYKKTRQTFYNYMQKWLIESKKVHNKIYLKISDIEKMISRYLDQPTQAYVYDTESDTYTYAPTEETPYTSSATSASLEEVYEKITEIDNEIHEELLTLRAQQDLQTSVVTEQLTQEIASIQTSLSNRLESISSHIFTVERLHSLRHKKLFFYIGYLLFAGINACILRVLYWA